MISAEHTAYIIHPEHDAKQMAIRDSLLERDKALAAATERAEKAELAAANAEEGREHALRHLAEVERERDGALKEAKRNAFDASVGRELEAAICMETHFTGEEPYVGTAGLILAIKECAEAYRERDALKKLVEEAVPYVRYGAQEYVRDKGSNTYIERAQAWLACAKEAMKDE